MTSVLRWLPLVLVAAVGTPSCTDPCRLLSWEAKALKHEYSRCQTDDQCAAYSLENSGSSFIPGFQCGVALSVREDIDEFTRRYHDLSDQYPSACGAWGMPQCQGVGGVYCDVETAQCAVGGGSSDEIDTTPNALQFGTLPLGMSRTLCVDVSNIGDDTEYLEDIHVADPLGAASQPFHAELDQVGHTLAPGESVPACATCTPVDTARREGTLSIHFAAPSGARASVPLICTGN